MARGKLAGYSEKRKILFSKTMSAEEVDRAGQEFLDEKRFSEALDLFEKSGNKEKIRIVVDKARDMADASLWLRAIKLLGEKPTSEMWEGMAEHALNLGKEHFAVWAFDQAGKKERADAMRQEWQRKEMARLKEKGKE